MIVMYGMNERRTNKIMRECGGGVEWRWDDLREWGVCGNGKGRLRDEMECD